jgi:hypothetical protein
MAWPSTADINWTGSLIRTTRRVHLAGITAHPTGRVVGVSRARSPAKAADTVRDPCWQRPDLTLGRDLGLRGELAEVEDGLVAVSEGDDDAGPAADGGEVGVEDGQEQVVGLLDAVPLE